MTNPETRLKQDLLNEQECRATVIQELHISVTPVGDDEYLVRTEKAPRGVLPAEELVSWPVDDWLRQASELMDDPLLGLLRGSRVHPGGDSSLPGGSHDEEHLFSAPESKQTQAQNLVTLGQQLYKALFKGSVRDRLMSAQAIAHNRGQVLRLRLGLKGNRLPRLPWEVLHEDTRPIATGTDVVFSRYQPTLSPLALPIQQNQPLKILMVLAAPTDRENLELKREAQQLQEELQSQSRNSSSSNRRTPEIQLTILDQPDREQLTQALEQRHYHVLHYAGHSNLGANGGTLYLVSGKTGLTETLSGDDLAGLLVNNGISMALFNSCRSAYTATADANNTSDRNIAEVLVKRGVPTVLAMAERIPDDVALTLTRLFYRNLSQGYPVDLSLSRARQGLISAYGSHQLYWALPILYLHSEFDGYLTEQRHVLDSPDTISDESVLTRSFALLDAPPMAQTSTYPSSPIGGPYGYLEDEDLNPDEVEEVFDEIEYEEDDLGDADDVAVVSDLFRQIQQRPEAEPRGRDRTADPERHLAQSISDTPQTRAITPTAAHAGTFNAPTTPSNHSPGQSTPVSNSARNTASFNLALVPTWLQRAQRRRLFWPGIAVAGISAIAVFGLWSLRGGVFRSQPSPEDLLPPLPSQPLQTTDLKSADNKTLSAIAIEQFSVGNIAAAEAAVTELLRPERGAITYAESALTAVPKANEDDAAINFLKGRVAWQAAQTGDTKYSVSDARRFWDRATQKQPNAFYYNALGFAYYAEGNLERASDVWLKSLTLAEEATANRTPATLPNPTIPTASPSAVNPATPSQEALTAYAGLALVLMKTAPTQPDGNQASTLSKAIKMRQMVLSDDPINFQLDSLAQNWLWTETAIQDWDTLLKQQEK